MMFEKLTLINFQAHRKLVVELDPHVTSIIGPTDAGKSSILRGLRWVCMNDPSGDEFISWDQKNVKVSLTVDGHTITRRKGSANTYHLDGKEFKAFGTRVPPEVAKLLNIGEVNFQQQLEEHFWFSKTPGQVSRELNQIVNLGMIDSVLGTVSSKVRDSRSIVTVSRQRLKAAKDKRESLAWIPTINKELKQLEELEVQIKKQRGDVAALDILLDDVATRRKAKRLLDTQLAQCEKGVLKLDRMYDKLYKLQIQMKRLDDLLESLYVAKVAADDQKAEADKWEAILETKTKGRCPVCGKKT